VCEVGKDLPVAALIGVCQRAPRNLGAETCVVELGPEGTQTDFDVAEAFPIRQLGEAHAEKLIATRELSTTPIATVSLHACVEVATWKKIQELRKQELPVEHKTTLPFPAAENPPSRRLNVLPS